MTNQDGLYCHLILLSGDAGAVSLEMPLIRVALLDYEPAGRPSLPGDVAATRSGRHSQNVKCAAIRLSSGFPSGQSIPEREEHRFADVVADERVRHL
jgi:hypothetical protein